MNPTDKLLGITRRQFVTSSALAAAGASLVPTIAGTETLANGALLPQTASAPSRVILDTDTGVDDAFALLFAMRSPELKIEAITAVSGNVPLELTLPNAMRMVEIAGRTDIPVAAGAKVPLLRRLVTPSTRTAITDWAAPCSRNQKSSQFQSQRLN